MSETTVLLDGLGFPESTRWHGGRVWLCNWGSGEVLAVAPEGGGPEVAARVPAPTLPFSIDWLPDGRLLIIDGPRRLLLRVSNDDDAALEVHADLSSFAEGPFNELVVDAAGNAYVNGGAGLVVLVRLDGRAETVADGLGWPNGMALIDDGATLVVADSHAKALLAYAVADDATLSAAREWAPLADAPDGICVDAEGAIWVASVPGRGCLRVRKGGEIADAVRVDRGCFACMLGGEDGRTLFIAAATWRGMEAAMSEGPGTTGRLLSVGGRAAAHAGRP